jgi:hypothetical protein
VPGCTEAPPSSSRPTAAFACRLALQLLPHRARSSCTPTWSRPELAQRRHRHALHAAALHVVALHAIALHAVALLVNALHSSSSFFCCRIRAYSGLATSLPCTPKSRAFLARGSSCYSRPRQTITRYSTRRALLSSC